MAHGPRCECTECRMTGCGASSHVPQPLVQARAELESALHSEGIDRGMGPSRVATAIEKMLDVKIEELQRRVAELDQRTIGSMRFGAHI